MPSAPVRAATRVCGALALAAALSAVGAAPVSAAAVQPNVSECSADYALLYEWGTGFAAEVTITSEHEPIQDWLAQWNFSQGQQVTQVWNAEINQYDSRVEAKDPDIPWNGGLPTPTTASFGFTATGAYEVPDDLACWVNPYRLW